MPAVVSKRSCTLCGQRTSVIVWSEPRGRLVRCSGCGLVYLDAEDTIDLRYWEDHDLAADPTADFYWNKAREAVFTSFLDRYTQAGDRLLDVGSGKGYFVASCRRRGIEAYGIEVSHEAAQWANHRHGPWFKEGLIESDTFKASSYDIVTLWDVIEHLPNPKRVLLACARVLKPGGRLFIQTPNVNFHLPYAYLKRWFGFDRTRGTYMELPDHVHHFSPKTLTRLCLEAGFTQTQVLVMRPVQSVAGRRSRTLAFVKDLYVAGAGLIYRLTGIDASNSLHMIAIKGSSQSPTPTPELDGARQLPKQRT